MFQGAAAYSQQISAQMPAPYLGLAAQGFGGFGGMGGQPQFPSMPYGAQQQAGFRYGGHSMGYGPGNTLGNAGVSALGGGLPAAFGVGSMIAAPSFNPFSMGMAGYRMGGLAGAAAGVAAPLMVGAAMTHMGSSMVHGAQEQAGIEQTLSQFQFSNAKSRTGRGFSRQDSMQIGNMVRELAHIPEMLTSVSELTRVMGQLGQSGMMNGVRDAQEFQRKFKETLKTVRDVARIMGGSLEEAAEAMRQSRQAGFYSQADIMKNVIGRQVTGAVTGMNPAQVGALQSFGAELGHRTGGSRATGARSAMRMANQLGTMNLSGKLSNDEIMEMTGKEGAEGIQDLAANMTQLGHRMARSSVGTAATLALGEMKDGKYTGKMDEDLVRRFREEGIGSSELLSMARKKAGTRGAKLSFAAHRDRLTSEMVGQMGPEGMGMMLQTILGKRGWKNPDAQSLVMQRFGATEEQANLIQKMTPNIATAADDLALASQTETRRMAQQQYARDNFSLGAIKRKLQTRVHNALTAPFEKIGVGIRSAIQNATDDFVDDLTGRYTTEITKGTSDLVTAALSGSKSAQTAVQSRLGSMASSGLGASALAGAKSAQPAVQKLLASAGMPNLLPSEGALSKGLSRLADPQFQATANLEHAKSKLSAKEFATLKGTGEDIFMDSRLNGVSDPKERQQIAEKILREKLSVLGPSADAIRKLRGDSTSGGNKGVLGVLATASGMRGLDSEGEDAGSGGAASAAKKLREVRKEMSGRTGFSVLEAEIKKDSQLSKLFGGLFGANAEKKKALQTLLKKDPKTWDKGDKDLLKSMGIADPDKLETELAKNNGLADQVVEASDSKDWKGSVWGKTSSLAEYTTALRQEEKAALAQNFRERGKELAGSLKGVRGYHGKEAVGAASALADDLKDNPSKVTDKRLQDVMSKFIDMGDAHGERGKILSKMRSQGGAWLTGGIGQALSVMQDKKSKTLKDFGITEDSPIFKEAQAALGGDSKIDNEGERKNLAKLIGGGKAAKDLVGKDGTTQQGPGSETEFAKHLSQFGGHVVQLGQIVTNLAGGKPAAEGLNQSRAPE